LVEVAVVVVVPEEATAVPQEAAVQDEDGEC
jgi:hypothetical protein